MKLKNHELGTYFENNYFHGLFGNKSSQIQSLQSQFPEQNFKRVKQVHGDRIVHTSPHSVDFSSEADAHYTNEKNLSLAIVTADCIPIFMFHQNPTWVMGIHAGWRGVEKKIVPKAVRALSKLGCKLENLTVLIGPHIQKPSFEVGNDVRDALLKSVLIANKSSFFEDSDDGKSLVDLHLLLKTQLEECQVDPEKIFVEFKDTFSDSNYQSFRRDKESSGRQLSWISLK